MGVFFLHKHLNITYLFHKMQYIMVRPISNLGRLLRRRIATTLLVQFRAALSVFAAFLLLANCAVWAAAAGDSAAVNIPGDAVTTGDPDAYLAQLRAALPQSWLQREFQRQRSFPAFAHSRPVIAKGQFEDALRAVGRD